MDPISGYKEMDDEDPSLSDIPSDRHQDELVLHGQTLYLHRALSIRDYKCQKHGHL